MHGEIKKKVLMLASVASMIDQFNMPNIQLLQEMGYEVHVACNFEKGNTCDAQRIDRLKEMLEDMGAVMHQWDCPRSAASLKEGCRAYRQLWEITGRHCFTWIHCHSPIGGAIARMIAYRRNIRVIYTAHGFHFYKGAPLKNWLFYYPVEKLLAHWTDLLITVNQEDYHFAKQNLRAKKIYHIRGVGIDLEKYSKEARVYAASKGDIQCVPKQSLHEMFGIPSGAMILLSVGELNKGKNHKMAIAALAALQRKDVYYLICGQGKLRGNLQRYADRLYIGNQIRMPGYQQDMPWIYKNADIFVFPSLREGMPCALMEAMAAGLPCAVTDIRGSRELIGREMRVQPGHTKQLQNVLERLLADEHLRDTCGNCNRKKIQAYSLYDIQKKMKKIYQELEADIVRDL